MNIIGNSFKNIEKVLCDYGCGNIAKYITSNGKFCCSEYYTKCPENRKKYGSPGMKNPMYGKSANKYSIQDWKNKYIILFNLGESKIENNKIYVCCKKCNKWFRPSYETFRARYNALLYGNKRNYFFCSDECKETSLLYRLKYEPFDLKKYHEYHRIVKLKTESSIKRNKDKILNIEKRSRKYPIDHKFSVREGFNNNIDPDIVSHWKNLEIITIVENSRKNKKCSITLNELKEQILEDENGKN